MQPAPLHRGGAAQAEFISFDPELESAWWFQPSNMKCDVLGFSNFAFPHIPNLRQYVLRFAAKQSEETHAAPGLGDGGSAGGGGGGSGGYMVTGAGGGGGGGAVGGRLMRMGTSTPGVVVATAIAPPPVGRCTSRIQFTHSSKAPGFNPGSYKVKTWFVQAGIHLNPY
jgi:hypothetical protein